MRNDGEAYDLLWPMTRPQISSFGIVLCTVNEKAIRTRGSHGALNVIRPRRLRCVSGFRRLQIYTNTELNAVPRNAMLNNGAIPSNIIDANIKSHVYRAGDLPDASSTSREYRWRKKRWKRRSMFRGPK